MITLKDVMSNNPVGHLVSRNDIVYRVMYTFPDGTVGLRKYDGQVDFSKAIEVKPKNYGRYILVR